MASADHRAEPAPAQGNGSEDSGGLDLGRDAGGGFYAGRGEGGGFYAGPGAGGGFDLGRALDRGLETVVLLLMSGLALLVVVGVVFRKAGAALVWYDELASITLAWLTFYGAALAARRRAHIGFPRLVEGAPLRVRRLFVLLREVAVIGFFVAVAWAGWRVQGVLAGSYLVSMPSVPTRLAHSVIPLGALVFVVAELTTIPQRLTGARPVELAATGSGDPPVRRLPEEEP